MTGQTLSPQASVWVGPIATAGTGANVKYTPLTTDDIYEPIDAAKAAEAAAGGEWAEDENDEYITRWVTEKTTGLTLGEDGKTVVTDREGDPLTWRDQVVRHDARLQKKGSPSGEKLALVPFLITNVTTGEAHVAVTDRNGMLSTSSEWRSRETVVNANDRLLDEDYIHAEDVVEESGIWFGQGEDGSEAAPDRWAGRAALRGIPA